MRTVILEASFHLLPAEWQKQAVDKLATDCVIDCLHDRQISAGKDLCDQQKPNEPARSALMSRFARA